MRPSSEEIDGEEIIVRSLKQPSCVKVEIVGNDLKYIIEKELGIELVGDIKVKIEANSSEDPWEEIVDETKVDEELNNIEAKISDNFIDDKSLN